jgi:hypothetical protein
MQLEVDGFIMTTFAFSFSNIGLVGCTTIACKTLALALLMCLHGTNTLKTCEEITCQINVEILVDFYHLTL